jgi:Prasinovirus endonuclease VII
MVRASAMKSGKTMDLIGCTVPELKAHLARQFSTGMSWKNYGHGHGKWNVDHRLPCAAFDLTDPEQQRRCFHFSNLQPMWHLLNVQKGARIDAVTASL